MNGDDHFSSKISVGGLLNTDKVNLVGSITNNHQLICNISKVCLILDNLEIYHKHHRQLLRYVPSEAAAQLCEGSPNGAAVDVQNTNDVHAVFVQQHAQPPGIYCNNLQVVIQLKLICAKIGLKEKIKASYIRSSLHPTF